MQPHEIENTVIRLSAEQVGADPASVSRGTHYVNDLRFDSLDAVDLAMRIEEALAVGIPDDQIEKLQSVGQMIDYVRARRQSEQSLRS